MTQPRRVQAQLLNPTRKSVVASGLVTLYCRPAYDSQQLSEVHATIDFDSDRVDLAGKPLLLRFNDQVSGLVSLHFQKDQEPVSAILRRFEVDWLGTRWDDLRWVEEV